MESRVELCCKEPYIVSDADLGGARVCTHCGTLELGEGTSDWLVRDGVTATHDKPKAHSSSSCPSRGGGGGGGGGGIHGEKSVALLRLGATEPSLRRNAWMKSNILSMLTTLLGPSSTGSTHALDRITYLVLQAQSRHHWGYGQRGLVCIAVCTFLYVREAALPIALGEFKRKVVAEFLEHPHEFPIAYYQIWHDLDLVVHPNHPERFIHQLLEIISPRDPERRAVSAASQSLFAWCQRKGHFEGKSPIPVAIAIVLLAVEITTSTTIASSVWQTCCDTLQVNVRTARSRYLECLSVLVDAVGLTDSLFSGNGRNYSRVSSLPSASLIQAVRYLQPEHLSLLAS